MAKRREKTLSEQEVASFQARLRSAMGDLSEAKFAAKANISQSGLHRILNGGLPSMDILIAIAIAGDVTVEWLATGKELLSSGSIEEANSLDGESLLDRTIGQLEKSIARQIAQRKPSPAVNPKLMERLAGIVSQEYRHAGHRITAEKLVFESALMFNDLLNRVSDMNDAEEIELAIAQLQHLIRRRLREASDAPGTGKRSA